MHAPVVFRRLALATSVIRHVLMRGIICHMSTWQKNDTLQKTNLKRSSTLRYTSTAVISACTVYTVMLALHCRNPQHTVLGFSWGSSDEKKMQKSFGLGRQQLFDRFLDLQSVTQGLGYQMMGLTKLTETVLGCPNHKSKKVMPWCRGPYCVQASSCRGESLITERHL